jgi:2-polyprenyl-3-methyl-5-hydroxy-6-metoxy-1,4-benzoquinol methylase
MRNIPKDSYTKANCCRACTSQNINIILPLRQMPVGDKYGSTRRDTSSSPVPSSIYRCFDCGHIQMESSVDASYLYESYLSRPATTNAALSAEYKKYAVTIAGLAGSANVLEIGSNDGLFLKNLADLGVNCVGIEPAQNLHEYAAQDRGVNSIHGFFSPELVEKFDPASFSVIFANHAISNIEHIRNVASGVQKLLTDGGIFIMQTFYQRSVLEQHLIENYNHEHLSYFTVSSAAGFFRRFGLEIFDASFIDAKGGSIRCFFEKATSGHTIRRKSQSLLSLLDGESRLDVDRMFEATRDYISVREGSLPQILRDFAGKIGKVGAYGTSIGATVFLYQFGLENQIDCFFDDDALRQHRLSPGSFVPVRPGADLSARDYPVCLITAPLYADAIIAKNNRYLSEGGVFVKFWPQIEVVRR